MREPATFQTSGPARSIPRRSLSASSTNLQSTDTVVGLHVPVRVQGSWATQSCEQPSPASALPSSHCLLGSSDECRGLRGVTALDPLSRLDHCAGGTLIPMAPSTPAFAIPPLAGFALNWLADAEISATPGRDGACGLSFFFTDAIEYARFCRAAELPAEAVARAASIRARFELVPREWVKLHYQNEQCCGLSQYFVVDPRTTYPITTLRLCLQQCGLTDTRGLEPVFEPALQRADTLWAAIAKQSGAQVRARLSCRVPRALLAELLARAGRQGYVSERLAARHLEHDARIDAGAYAYLSLDPELPDSCSVDYEDLGRASIPDVCSPLWPADDTGEERRYLKCRLAPGDGVQWTVYRSLAAVLTAEQLSRLCAAGDGGDSYRARVRAYYDAHNATILREVGATYQAGLIEVATATPAAAESAAAPSNRYLAERAGLAAGQRLLDAGCGTCGPSIDACRAIPGLVVEAVTISPQQAASATQSIRAAGLSARIQVQVADYHALPFDDASFDRVWFLEAFGYADDPARVLTEVLRVLRRGGRVYVKDVFRRAGSLTAAERLELAEFDRVYVQRTPTAEGVAAALRGAGFSDVEMTDLSERISTEAFHRAMRRGAGLAPAGLSDFGRQHYRSFTRLPLRFVELRATKR